MECDNANRMLNILNKLEIRLNCWKGIRLNRNSMYNWGNRFNTVTSKLINSKILSLIEVMLAVNRLRKYMKKYINVGIQ